MVGVHPASARPNLDPGLKPKPLSPGSLTDRDRRGTTWPLRGAQAGAPFVPVGNTNRDQKASTRQHMTGAGFFLKGGGVRGLWMVNLGVSYIVLAS